jgi:exonuclease SbcC
MNPVEIRLENFTNYHNVTINLNDLHVTGLLGANGSGKSSFIEAIVWSLYGESPKGGKKAADNYVRTGCDYCTVDYIFEFNNNTYRVTRSWNKVERKTSLELSILSDDQFVLLCKNATDAQDQIIRLLKMDYAAFCASAFAMQGKSDSFTSCSDSERKDILASILGLDIWDRLQKEVNSRIKEMNKFDIKNLKDEIAKLVEITSEEDSLNDELLEKVNHLEQTEQLIGTLQNKVDNLVVALASFNGIKNEIQTLKSSIQDKKDWQSRLQTDLEENLQKIDKLNQVLNATKIEYAGHVSTSAWFAKQIVNSKFTFNIEELKAYDKLAEEHNELEAEKNSIEKSSVAWEQNLFTKMNVLLEDIKRNESLAKLLTDLPCDNNHQLDCPLLDTALKASYSLPGLRDQKVKLASQKCPFASDLEDVVAKQKALGYDSNKHKELRSGIEELEKINGIKKELEIAEFKKNVAEEKITSTQKEICELGNKVTELNNDLIKIDDNIYSVEKKIQELEETLDPDKELDLGETNDILKGSLNDRDAIREEITYIRNKLVVISDANARCEEYNQKVAKLEEEMTALRIIERAANKKAGVPAVIMEYAIPEIESLANDLIDRISSGRFSIAFETQVESKSKDTVQEALKINIYDRGQVRPYQTYSGAQRFIFELSLRVAISKFLTYRMGTEVKTMIIDEGFSALDSANLAIVIDAIFEVANDFDKMFIITHDERLKDMMPQKLYFEDTKEGTKVIKEL